MDPISVLGVVSAVITFIEFSRTLLTGAKKLYKNPDGTVDTNTDLEGAQDLHQISTRLCTEFTGNNDAENQIRAVAKDCHEKSKILIDLLEKFKVPPNTNRLIYSLKTSWKMRNARSDVKEIKDRLREYQLRIMVHFMAMLQDESSKITAHIKTIENTCNALTVELSRQFNTLHNDLIQTTKEHIQSESNSTTKILGLIRDMQSKSDEIDAQIFILKTLKFSDIRLRYTQIYTASEDTCGWIFGHDPPSRTSGKLSSAVTEESITRRFNLEQGISEERRKSTSHEFVSWLQYGQNILHISGKAGSGKSTLMKFIASHPQTHKELQVWAGEKTLVTGDFYFWNPGTRLQMTLDGLYRSLLFAVLSRYPEMIKEVFSSEWKRIHEGDLLNSRRRFERWQSCNFTDQNSILDDNRVEKISITPRGSCDFNFERAFTVLTQKSQHARHRFCFFIDGLDECDGNKLDHEELAQKMKVWTEGGDVKICTSSRPYREFHTVLSSPLVSRISLHLLNQFDIWTYCVNKFGNDREAGKTIEYYTEIINDIAMNSQGVFLWAHLVVDIILLAIRQGDPYHILHKKLGEIPQELDRLYDKLREPILEKSKIDKERADKMLLLALRNSTSNRLSAIAFSWFDEKDARYNLDNSDFPDPLDISLLPYSEDEYKKRVEKVGMKIDSLTRGFLELNSGGHSYRFIQPWFSHRVNFSHRTARDYFLKSEGKMENLEESFPNFKESNPYGRICLAELFFGFKELSWEMNDGGSMSVFKQWLMGGFPKTENIDDKICRKIQQAVQRLQPWLLLFLQSYYSPNSSAETVLWACLGYSERVIELPSLGCPRMILDALGRKDWLSAAKHIIDSGVLDHPIRVEVLGSEAETWPLWTILSIFIAHHQFSNHDYANKDIAVLNQALHDHVIRNADDLQVTIQCRNIKEYNGSIRFLMNWRVLMNVLILAKNLENVESTPFIQIKDIGMPNESENVALRHALQDKETFAFREVQWRGKMLGFYNYAIAIR
ncbi:hypothetical protein F4806DRAFT_427188 [Annulohypoxylon nitens]|nr:hypothetical protein F4806DRAFT_427188 [Annulohypoxylon nitens]